MTKRVLILGGRGRIGRSVAADLVTHTTAEVMITGRETSAVQEASDRLGNRITPLPLDLADQDKLRQVLRSLKSNADSPHAHLVIHCAGPFHDRDASVLKLCIEEKVNYLDVSDNRAFTRRALALRDAAKNAGVTAIINSGIFPGISNSMVRQGVESLDQPEQIHLSYVVSSSGGAGITVMRTTFLGLQQPFEVWQDGRWQTIKPYSQREAVEFPSPFGTGHIYWFDMPEAFTLVETFPSVKTVVTKFGSIPDFYNHLTWIAAHWFPKSWMQQRGTIEFLSQVSHRMTSVTDRISGIGVAIRSEVSGYKNNQPARYVSSLVHENTAIAAGYGTGSLAEFMLSGELQKPGVWPVEQALPTDLFEKAMISRGLTLHTSFA